MTQPDPTLLFCPGNITGLSSDGSYTFRAAEDSLTSLPKYWDLGESHWAVNYQYAFSHKDQYAFTSGVCGTFQVSQMVPLGGRDYR